MCDHVELVCSDGEVVRIWEGSSGLSTGYAKICNPYFEGDPDWRFKDGDTVMGCLPTDRGAMLVQDAYQKIRGIWAEEESYFRDLDLQMEEQAAERAELAAWEPVERLYRIQDALSNGRRP